MKSEGLFQKATDLTGEEIRKGKVIQNVDTLRALPDLVGSVRVDREKMKNYIHQSMCQEGVYNPVNVVLGVFGYRMVSEDGITERIVPTDEDMLDDFITIDELGYRQAVEKIAGRMARAEQAEKDTRDALNERILRLSENGQKTADELNEYKNELLYLRRSMAEQIQYMLGQLGREQEDSEPGRSLHELLNVMNVTAVWDADGDSKMFTVLKTEQPERCKNKPCMVFEGEVLLQGLRFEIP
ncbi:MAG: hypothetical protein LIO75_07745 [Lachnospiraceae bacterium]|nr:hypothetical protein [Lachnospiraceae bacterium]